MGKVHFDKASCLVTAKGVVTRGGFSCVFGKDYAACDDEKVAGGFTERAKAVLFAIVLDKNAQFRFDDT